MNVEEIKDTVEGLNKAWTAFQSRNDEVGEKHDDELEKINAHLDKLGDRLNNLNGAVGASNDNKGAWRDSVEGKAFLTFARKGIAAVTPEELKVLNSGDDTAGGYLAPTEFIREIIKGVTQYSPMRELARVRSTSRHAIQIPKRTGVFSAVWSGEQEPETENAGLSYGMEELITHKLRARVDITLENLEDSEFNMESELGMEFAEQFGVAEGAAFITGTGIKQPEGILMNADVATVNSGHATLIQADGLIDLWAALPSPYASQATWVLNRNSIGAIRKLKDSQNQYLWQPGLSDSVPGTILGVPYREAPDMPDQAADSTPIAIGDWQRAYTIVDRVSLAVKRDDSSGAADDTVVFWARRRVGGQVVLADAIRKQTIAA